MISDGGISNGVKINPVIIDGDAVSNQFGFIPIGGRNGATRSELRINNASHLIVAGKKNTNSFFSSSLDYFNLTSPATLATNEYVTALSYAIPSGYVMYPVLFSAHAGNVNNIARLAEVIDFGSFNTATNVYTDAFSATFPRFYSSIEAQVTTALSATATTLTITYVNQDGVGGRTATATIPASAAVGRRIRATLDANDVGVIDVTNVTDSANPAGVVRIQGVNTISALRMTTAEAMFSNVITDYFVPRSSGVTINLEYATRTGTLSTSRGLHCAFVLEEV